MLDLRQAKAPLGEHEFQNGLSASIASAAVGDLSVQPVTALARFSDQS